MSTDRASRSSLRWALCIVGTIVSTSSSAVALEPPASSPVSAKDQADARTAYDAGVKLYQEKLYELALEQFTRSYRLGGRPSALRNAAQCLRDLKRMGEAYQAYDQLLSRHASELKPADREATRKALGELAQITGTINLQVQPAGAEVVIDGRSIGRAPFQEALRLSGGPHALEARADDHQPSSRTITVTPGQNDTIEVVLAKKVVLGRAIVREASAIPAEVLVDGKVVGPAPWDGEVPVGTHTIQLRAGERVSEPRSIEITTARAPDVVIPLTTTGTLVVVTHPDTAEILVDGNVVGTGSFQRPLPAGLHRVEVRAEGHEVRKQEVLVELGRTQTLDMALAPKGDHAKIDPRTRYRGLSARLSLGVGFGLHGQPSTPRGDNESTYDIPGGALALRVGYNFDPIAVELIVSGLGDGRYRKESFRGTTSPTSSTLDSTYPHDVEYTYIQAGGFIGTGARVTSRDESIRFTAGLGFGASIRNRHLEESFTVARVSSVPSRLMNETVAAPALVLDGAITLGSTPGTRFVLGIEMWLEFTGQVMSSANATSTVNYTQQGVTRPLRIERPARELVTGVQVYVGPMIGLQFGR